MKWTTEKPTDKGHAAVVTKRGKEMMVDIRKIIYPNGYEELECRGIGQTEWYTLPDDWQWCVIDVPLPGTT